VRRLAVRLPLERAEDARALLEELAPAGWEEVELDGGVELAIYGDEELAAALAGRFGAVGASEVEPGWERRWREFHRPVRIGPLWVGPPWEAPPSRAAAIVIEPAQAFGTGAHATTRLCLELLLRCEPQSVVDLGCGSGVLAVAAARLGFAPVVAVDRDAAAVAAAAANARANGIRIDAVQADVKVDSLPHAELALANLDRALVPVAASRFEGRLLIASGYLAGDSVAPEGWRRLARRQREGWAADLFERRSEPQAGAR
jgi:ribosomal protein L11 methyltransferase